MSRSTNPKTRTCNACRKHHINEIHYISCERAHAERYEKEWKVRQRRKLDKEA